jgi:hypothetical protein
MFLSHSKINGFPVCQTDHHLLSQALVPECRKFVLIVQHPHLIAAQEELKRVSRVQKVFNFNTQVCHRPSGFCGPRNSTPPTIILANFFYRQHKKLQGIHLFDRDKVSDSEPIVSGEFSVAGDQIRFVDSLKCGIFPGKRRARLFSTLRAATTALQR